MGKPLRDWENRIGRRLKLRDLHILSLVVQWGSMAKAATHLSMTQPAVSDAIAGLEDALRVKLLDRSSKGVEPTIYATALLKRGLVVFDELRQGIRDIEFLADPTVGEVRVGCPESLLAGVLPAIIDRLSHRYPQVVVHAVDAQPTTTKYRQLRERNLDLMLGRIFKPLVDDEIAAEILFEDQYIVVAGVQSPWARRRKIALAELLNEPWIHMPADNMFGSSIAAGFHAHGLEVPRKSVITFSMHLRNELLATGRFLTIVPASLLHSNAERWPLKALPIDLSIPPLFVAIFTLKKRTLSPVAELFIEHAREVAKSIAKSR
jgi:DNA-binding transcriptional LysR family regulator